MPRNDFSDPNEAKDATRLANFRAAQEGVPLIWSRVAGCLRADWLELCGQRAPTCALLRAHGALNEGGRFIGVDADESAVASSREANGDEHAEWIVGDLLELIVDRDPRFEDVGVLNYDSFDGVGEGDVHLERLHSLFEFAERQQEVVGAFLLILNFACPRKRKVEKSAAAFAKILRERTQHPFSAEEVMERAYVSRRVTMFNVRVRYGFCRLGPR